MDAPLRVFPLQTPPIIDPFWHPFHPLLMWYDYLSSRECLQWGIQMQDMRLRVCDLRWPLLVESGEHVVGLQIWNVLFDENSKSNREWHDIVWYSASKHYKFQPLFCNNFFDVINFFFFFLKFQNQRKSSTYMVQKVSTQCWKSH